MCHKDEVVKWKAGITIRPKFKAALRVDPLLSGNWPAVRAALEEAGFDQTIEGAKQFLREWAKVRPAAGSASPWQAGPGSIC
eukprot:SAG22_NODE_1639_length_3911_cov_21.500787_3_plen_82_part_00